MTPGPHALGNLPAWSGSSGDVRVILGGERPFVDSFIYLENVLSSSYRPDDMLAGCVCVHACVYTCGAEPIVSVLRFLPLESIAV